MKTTVIFSVFVLFLAFTACTQFEDASYITNPVVQKSITSSEEVAYPYEYLHSFYRMTSYKYYSESEKNSTTVVFDNIPSDVSYFFVVYTNNLSDLGTRTMMYKDKIKANTIELKGISESAIKDLKIYAYRGLNESVRLFSDGQLFSSIRVNGWKSNDADVFLDCAAWSSGLKFTFSEIECAKGAHLIFLQKPVSESFMIPEYGKYGVKDVNVFGYYERYTETQPVD